MSIKSLIYFIILTVSCVGVVGVSSAGEEQIKRSDIEKIKIISSSTDKVQLYVTSTAKKVYRISYLSENEAHTILDRLKFDQNLVLQTIQNANRNYLDVSSWQ